MNCCNCEKKYETAEWVKGSYAIVTGANSGIGKETARALVKKGIHVTIGCRNMDSAKTVVDELTKDINDKGGSIDAMELNLQEFSSVHSFVLNYKEKVGKLNILICNAGTAMKGTNADKEGYSVAFKVNYLSHFLLTKELLPLIKQSKVGRIVCLSSVAHRNAKGLFDQAAHAELKDCYAETKLAMCCFARELNRRLAQEEGSGGDIKAVAVNPGPVNSNIWRRWSFFYKMLFKMMFLSTKQGCRSSVYAAVADDIQGGEYITTTLIPISGYDNVFDTYSVFAGHCKANPSPICTSVLEKSLWESSEKWIEEHKS